MLQDTSLTTTFQDIYGYPRHELIGQSIPSVLDNESKSTRDRTRRNHYYANRSKHGRLQHLPSTSGLVTLHQNRMINSVEHLFGYKTMLIDRLLPRFINLVALIYQRRLLHHDRLASFKRYINTMALDSTTILTTTSKAGEKEPTNITTDTDLIDVALQIQWVENNDEDAWIVQNSSLLPTTTTGSLEPTLTSPITCTTNVTTTITTTEWNPTDEKAQEHFNGDTQHVDSYVSNQDDQRVIRQQSKPTLNRFESFGSKALFPSPPPTSIVFPDFDDYAVVHSLGQGTFGAVTLVHLKSDPSQEFAIKAIIKSRIIVDSWVRDRRNGSIPMEIHILLKLQHHQHANCPQLVTFMEDDDNYYTVTRLFGKGMDLFDYIELNDAMTETQVRRVFQQVAAAMQHLHRLGIVHRDIKDENILLDDCGMIQLIDFGSAAYYRKGRLFDTCCGTLDYVAPEILRGEAYTGPPQDIWSLGILLYTLIYRETPLYSVDDLLLPSIPYKEQAVADLLYRLLDRDISRRPTIDQVMQDPWLQSKD